MIKNLVVYFDQIIDPQSICKNPDISVAIPQGVTIVCLNDDNVEIQIDDSVGGPYCLTFIVKCSTVCATCDDQIITKCFCINSQDCTNCSTCENYICVSRCLPGQVCENETCGQCSATVPCPCNQLCVQGNCLCPPDKPIKRADGCCVQCIEGQTVLGPCEVCVNGMIVPKSCPDGHCDPADNQCKECINDSHCTGQNECCGPGGLCKCCLGFMRDPITNLCIPQPPCTSEAECMAKFGPCHTCTSTGCGPKTCPIGQTPVVVNGQCKCVQACSPTVPCPPGYGCINGGCVLCSELDCTGASGLQCQFAIGCHCTAGNTCEGIDCNPASVTLAWVPVAGTPGQVQPGSGLPALQGTALIEAIGIIYLQPPTGSGYQNHRFTLAITNGTTGSWTLRNTPSNALPLGSGTGVTFDLASTGPNMVMFVVDFVENGTGRTATWTFFREITAPLVAPDVWSFEFISTGRAPNVTGGTPGSLKLCANNANFHAVGVDNVVTSGTIQITFFPDPVQKNCLIAHVTGCGIWNGDMVVNCGGQTLTIPAPEFTRDPANCCDPTDPNCGGWGTGDPCTTVTIQPIDLVILPTYGYSGAGDGEFMAVADWASAGLTALQMFYLNPSPGCWSASLNPESSSNDLAVVTSSSQSPFGPSVSALSALFTFGDGGCIQFGHSCDLRIPGCKKIQGEECFEECDLFNVTIVQTGPNTYTAVPSMVDEPVTYVWSYPGLVNNSTQTVTITPQGGASTLTVTAFYGAPVKCNKTAILQLSTSIPGCTNTLACNHNPLANVDDGSCVILEVGTYDCALGYQPGVVNAPVGVLNPVISRKIGSLTITTNSKINPGTHQVDFYINGTLYCSKTLVVPQCYKCDTLGNCIPAPLNNNQGQYTTIDCDGVNCICNIEIEIAQRSCSNGQAAMYITATGDTGSYVVVVDRVDTGAQVLAGTNFTSAGAGVHTPVLCPGIYRVTVTGDNCNKSRDFQILCDTCTGSSLDLIDITHDCDLSQLTFTIVGAPCATNYNVQLLSNTMQPLSPVVSHNYLTAGTKNLIVGVRPAGYYHVRLTDNNGCVITKSVVICPDDLAACAIDEATLNYALGGTTVSFTATVVLNSNVGTYEVALYEVGPGSCPGAFVPSGAPLMPTEFISGNGIHTVNFVNTPILIPGSNTCYAVVITSTTDPACTMTAMVTVMPSVPPVGCSGSVTNVSYDPLTASVAVTWDFSNTSDSLTVQIQTGAGPACNPGDPVVLTSTGNGEDGFNILFGPIPQTQLGQFICVTIWDEANPTCKASMTATIPACSCAIEIIGTPEVHPNVPEIEVTYRAKCTSGLVDLDANGDANGTLTNQAATQNGLWVEYTKVIPLGSYPSPGGTTTVQVIDQVNGLCQANVEVVLPPNCVSCGQVASLYLNNSVVTAVKNFAGVSVVAGVYTLPTDAATLATDTYTELVDDGANFCAGASDVNVSATRDAGMSVQQDNTQYQSLDHAVIQHADWVGDKKVYFANCGCGITRLCDYSVDIPIGATADMITLRYATDNASGDYTGTLQFEIDTPQTFDASTLAALEAAIMAALTGTTCGNVVDAVTASYDSGTDVLSILIEKTNAGLGIIFTLVTSGSVIDQISDFTQSNCI